MGGITISSHRVVRERIDGIDAIDAVDRLPVTPESVLLALDRRVRVKVLDRYSALDRARCPACG